MPQYASEIGSTAIRGRRFTANDKRSNYYEINKPELVLCVADFVD